MDNARPLPHLIKLLRTEQPITVERGESIANSDQFSHLWYVDKGFVKRYQILSNGSISVQSIYGKGDAFSLSYVYNVVLNRGIYSGPETYYYEAMCPTTLYRISGEGLKNATKENPLIFKDLLMLASNRLESNIQLLENQGLADAHKQVAHQLAYYAQHFGQKKGNQYTISLPLTQQDIADILDLTRETVSTCINNLRHQNMLANKSHPITVINLEKLLDYAFS